MADRFKGLFVPADIPFTLEEGQTYTIGWGRYRILDLRYTNPYGEFILGESVEQRDDAVDSRWQTETGVLCHESNPLEILHVLYSTHSLSSKGEMVGFEYRDRQNQRTFAGTYGELWSLVFRHGATNAVATTSRYEQFTSRLVDSDDDLPSLDSYYWRKSVDDGMGEGVEWSPALTRNIERARLRRI